MDVQAVAPTLSSTTFAPPAPNPGAVATPPPAPVPVAAPAATPSGDGGSSAQTGLPAPPVPQTPGLALLPPAGGTAPGSGSGTQSLPGNVAKVYNLPEQNVQVSFQAAQGSNEIVTVFTDKSTGKVIVQFPSETLIALAQFFQKLDNSSSDNGAVVDKKV